MTVYTETDERRVPGQSRGDVAVAAAGITRRYGEGAVAVDALRGVSLSVEDGEQRRAARRRVAPIAREGSRRITSSGSAATPRRLQQLLPRTKRTAPQSRALVCGSVAPGFERVRAAFERNFSDRGELGGAVAVFVDGRPVVDLWGGSVDGDRTRPWCEDTIVLVFSTTKGLAAAAVAIAHSRGLLEYEEPVSRYWPEFAENGKENVTVRQLLAHQAGLCALDVQLDAATIADWRFLTGALARQRPLWEPGRRHGYHAFTLGWYESELIRRVDPQGRRLPAFFADEVARPLGAEFHIGLPEEIDPRRVATIEGWPAWKMLFHLRALPPMLVLAYMDRQSLTARTMGNPRLASPAVFDSEAYRHLENPAGIGFGSARAIASIYGDLATGGTRLGLRPATFEAIIRPPVPPADGAYDLVLHTPTSYALGWWRPFPRFPFGGASAFGAPGTGGSFGYADPAAGVGYAYVTNRMGYQALGDDPRDLALRDALRDCLVPSFLPRGAPAGAKRRAHDARRVTRRR